MHGRPSDLGRSFVLFLTAAFAEFFAEVAEKSFLDSSEALFKRAMSVVKLVPNGTFVNFRKNLRES